MNSAYLILGGNIGDRRENLNRTREQISAMAGVITSVSDIFVTAPWGRTDQPDFYNQALELHTELTPAMLLHTLLEIETMNGRQRDGRKWAERSIDIDILFFNDEVISEPRLKIPHPHLAERRFVLVPLAQIAGEKEHPLSGRTVSELLQECRDISAVQPLQTF